MSKSHDIKNQPVFAAIDMEMTGLDPESDKMIEVGIFKFTFDDNLQSVKISEYDQLINPEAELPRFVSLLTGITLEDLKSKPLASDVLPVIEKELQDVDYIVGHNVQFDLAFLKNKIVLPQTILDTLTLSEIFFPGVPSYSLDVLVHEMNLTRESAHRALDDARASAELLILCLRQFASLSKNKKEIIETLKYSGYEQDAELFSALPELDDKNLIRLQKPQKQKTIIEIKNKVNDSLISGGQNILNHPASPYDIYSIQQGASEFFAKQKTQTLVVVSDNQRAKDLPNGKHLPYAHSLVCEYKLHRQINKQLSKAKGLLMVKLMIAFILDPDLYFWPKLSNEEKKYLPLFLVDEKTCTEHNCRGSSVLQNLDKDNLLGMTHFALWSWQPERWKKQNRLVITNIDDAVLSLEKYMTVNFHINSIPNALEPLRQFRELAVENIIGENDIFWANARNNMDTYLLQRNVVTMDDQMKTAPEIKNLFKDLNKLMQNLEAIILEIKDENLAEVSGYADYLIQKLSEWKKIIHSPKYGQLKFFGQGDFLNLRLTPYPQIVAEEFKKFISPNTLICSDSQEISEHFMNYLGIEDWQVSSVDAVPHPPKFEVVKNFDKPAEKAIELILEVPSEKTIILAEDKEEVEAIATHLRQNLDGKKNIIALGKFGGGLHKTFYNFEQTRNTILVAPVSRSILNASWPVLEMAIITHLPYPAQTNKQQLRHAYEMIDYKNFLNKILKHSGAEIKIYIIDSRFEDKKLLNDVSELTHKLSGYSLQANNS